MLKGKLHEMLESLDRAIEKETGIHPDGTVQAEIRAVLSKSADYIHAMEADMKSMAEALENLQKESPHSRVATALERIEVKLDTQAKSFFSRIFGRS